MAAALSVLLLVCTALVDATATAPNSSLADSTPQVAVCPLDRHLLAGVASCSPGCPIEGTAACIAYSGATSVCNTTVSRRATNESFVPAPCPLLYVPTTNCSFQCFPSTPTTRNGSFTFYVTPKEMSTKTPWSEDKLHQSDRFVNTIGDLALPDRIQDITILGGVSVDANDVVVDVRVNMTLTADHVANLTLANLNMASTEPTEPIVEIRQSQTSTLQFLRITNCRLSVLPLSMSSLATLKTLDLSHNAFQDYPKANSLESLQHLNLRNNSLAAFGASFPALTTLDLSNNLLTAIPASVYLFTKLQSLNISGNALESSRFTPSEFEFLSKLKTLVMDDFQDDSQLCDPTKVKLLKTLQVCVMESTSVVVLTPSSLTWYIAGPIAGTIVVMLVGFCLWYYRRKNHHKLSQELAAKEASNNDNSTSSISSTTNKDASGAVAFMVLNEESSNDKNSSKNSSSTGSYPRVPSGGGQGQGQSHGAGSTTSTFSSSSSSLWHDEQLLACQLKVDDIEDLRQIGTGAFAVVWLVKYRQKRLLASKRLVKDHQLTRRKTQTFVCEIKLVSQLDHPSIVQFVGVAWTVETDLQALFEYMENGDLRDYLDSLRASTSTNGEFDWRNEKLQIAMDIVEALVYTHSFTPPLVHRDLKSRNILLGEGFRAKLSDFGVSRFQSVDNTMTSGVGTGKWLAPEVLMGGNDYDHKCDIYSLGVVLSELDTLALPYEELRLPDVAILQMIVASKGQGHQAVRPRFRDDCPREIRALANRCLAFDSGERPSAMEIAFSLRTFAKSLS